MTLRHRHHHHSSAPDNSSRSLNIDDDVLMGRLMPNESEEASTSSNQQPNAAYVQDELLAEDHLDRENTKLESFDTYVLVSTLIASASFSQLQDFEPVPGSVHELLPLLPLLTQISAVLSSLLGLYVTVVFSLSVLYGKSALGHRKDQAYQLFLDSTAKIRYRGFQAFGASLLTFAIQTSLVAIQRQPFSIVNTTTVLLLCLGLAAIIVRDWRFMVQSASIIYSQVSDITNSVTHVTHHELNQSLWHVRQSILFQRSVRSLGGVGLSGRSLHVETVTPKATVMDASKEDRANGDVDPQLHLKFPGPSASFSDRG